MGVGIIKPAIAPNVAYPVWGADNTLSLHFPFAASKSLHPANTFICSPVLNFNRPSGAGYWDHVGVWQVADADVARFDHDQLTNESLGLYIEPAATKLALHSRDLTNGVWAKTGLTAAKDVTGLDAIVNSATSLTSTAGGSNVVQTVTLASAERTAGMWVKRIGGTGNVDITDDNGVNWTTLTGLSSTDWKRYEITRTQANPSIGFRLVTSGDKIAVDFSELEAGPVPTSMLATGASTVTRELDTCKAPDLNWYEDGQPGTIYIEASQPYAVDNRYLFSISDGTANNRIVILSNGSLFTQYFIANGGDAQASITNAVLWVDGVAKKLGFGFAANDAKAYTNGISSGTDATVVLPSALDMFYIGANQTGGAQWTGHIREIRYFNRLHSNGDMIANT